MIKRFRKALKKGAGYTFTYKDRRYQVLDDITIYHYESDTVYFLDLDF